MIKIDQFELGFVAVGPQRTGTTWLHQILEAHPSIGLPGGIKETMFYDKYYDKGRAWLFSHYSHYGEEMILGEIAPNYFGSEIALDRIKSDYPNCKILINVRNPVEHAFSMYQHELSKGRIQDSLSEIIQNKPEKIRQGSYADWIPKWQANFGKENVCLIWMDQIKNQPEEIYSQVCDFLGISATHYSQAAGNRQVNSSKKPRFPTLTRYGIAAYHLLREYRLHSIINFCKRIHLDKITFGTNKNLESPRLTREEFSALVELYTEDISFLERISGRDLNSWRHFDG